MAAVAKLLRLLCVLADRATGEGFRWRWTSAVRLMGVESGGRWEKRAADLEEQEQIKVSKLSVTRRRANVSYRPMEQFRPGAKAYLDGDNLNNDIPQARR